MIESLLSLGVEGSTGTRNETSPVHSASAALSPVVFCPVLIKRHIASLWGHPGHCRGHLLPHAVRQNDLCVLTDQRWVFWKKHKSHRAAFCWEHCCCVFFLREQFGWNIWCFMSVNISQMSCMHSVLKVCSHVQRQHKEHSSFTSK